MFHFRSLKYVDDMITWGKIMIIHFLIVIKFYSKSMKKYGATTYSQNDFIYQRNKIVHICLRCDGCQETQKVNSYNN